MAEPVKISPPDELEESPEERREGLAERRHWPGERAAGYFRRRPYAKWILLALALLVIAAGLFVWRYYSVRESTDDAQIDGHIDPISARVSGTVLRVLHDENEFVNSGTLLVELDPKDYEVAMERARADLADAEANATAAQTGVPLTTTTSSSQLVAADAAVTAADREVDANRARVQEAQANSNKAASDLKRFQQLVQKDEISQQQYDTATAAASAAEATLQSARAMLANAESRAAQARAQAASAHTVPEQVKVTKARAYAAAAQVQKYRAALSQAELNLQYTKIMAPVSGVVSKVAAEPGQVVQPGQPLFSIVNLDDVWVTANFKETQLKNMRPGQKVRVRVDAYGRDYDGTVESIGGATGARFSLLPPENASGNYVKVVQRVPVRIRLNKNQDPNRLLRPGLSVVPTVFVK
ncbi:MAG TPA: HlyD family secretion protein [Candidatus Angelobacter sp.]